MSFIVDTFFGGAEKKAGKQRAAGITEGVAEQRRQFDLTRQDFAPGIERGNLAGDRLSEFLGLRGAEAEQAALAGFTESPGQAFLRERGERSLLRNSAAIGGLGGGNVRTALQEQGIGLAGQFLGERKDRLAGLAGQGLGAVGQQAVVGGNISSNIANLFAERGDVLGSAREATAAGRRSGLARIALPFI